MTRDELKAQFLGLMNRRDLTANAALADTFLDQGIVRVQRMLRVPAMEKMIDITIGSTYSGLIIPNDMLELKYIRPISNLGSKRLVKHSLDNVLALAQYTGCPRHYVREGGMFLLGPAPVAGDVLRVNYYAELPPLVNGTDENVISIIAWDLIVYAALVQAATYYVDNRKADFETAYQQAFDALDAQATADELGDDAAVLPAYCYPDDD